MPVYGPLYKIVYSNDLNELIEINIDQLGYTGAAQQLKADDDCLNIKCTVGDEDKLAPVCGSEATIKIKIDVDSNVDISNFIAPQDNFIRVTCFQEQNYAQPIFQGFVVVEDNSMPLLDPPFSITIKATDCLGTLQGVYFLDANGNPFSGKMTIVGWLAQILNQTGQTLNLRTYFNVYNASFIYALDMLDQTCLDAITFQTGQQTPAGDTNPADFNTGFDDYYTVLEKIVRNLRCKIFQEDGYWHLVNLWDYMNPRGFQYFEYSFGAPVNGIVPHTVVGRSLFTPNAVSIGKTQTLRLVQEDAQLYLKLAKKSVELTYNYNQALNKIINQNLGQGVRQPAQDEVISSTVIDPSFNHGVAVNLQTQAYNLFGWLLLQCNATGPNVNQVNRLNATAADPSQEFIRVVLDLLSTEVVRFMVCKMLAGPTMNFVASSRILIDVNDIFQLTFSWRTRAGTGIANARWAVAYVFLYGDDGSYWALDCLANGTLTGNPTKWVPTNSNFANTDGTVESCQSEPIASTLQWSDVEINTQTLVGIPYAQAPVSGEIEVVLIGGLGSGQEFWYKDIAVKILPYLNGSFAQLQGDYNYAESSANIMATELDTVEISDSPKRYFQGALLTNAAGYVLMPPTWYRVGQIEQLRFTQIMAYLIYVNFCRIIQKIEGTLKGLSYPNPSSPIGKSPSGLRNIYYFVDIATPTKKFMLCSFDKDYNKGLWRGVFIEVNQDQNDPGTKPPDFYEFSYLFTGLT